MLMGSKSLQQVSINFQETVEYRSNTTAAGVRFTPTIEAALAPMMRSLAASLPRAHRGVAMMAEVPGPVGIPDLVVMPAPGKALKNRLASGIPPVLKQAHVHMLVTLKFQQGTGVRALAKRLGKSDEWTAAALRELSQNGAAILRNGLAYRAEEVRPTGRIYALEAKVDDWRSGVRQAFRYRAWCDASVLVVARMPKDKTPLLEAVRRLHLGLACGDEWIIRPRISPIGMHNRLLGSEHFVAAIGFTPTRFPLP
ncbi:hypothetical protein [Streptomyces millisiae]|uniref:Uncharacterized protein n=1 Tax=Streptomyces millisiae TaxID=3075542 RepID=A0ABU2LKG3_9ACTN|nr:hypothetical protein [Streptomyces sp. DSM 44918]MDT0318082.1 hypothetical protein [Streptomyces sp. DSM 44918]